MGLLEMMFWSADVGRAPILGGGPAGLPSVLALAGAAVDLWSVTVGLHIGQALGACGLIAAGMLTAGRVRIHSRGDGQLHRLVRALGTARGGDRASTRPRLVNGLRRQRRRLTVLVVSVRTIVTVGRNRSGRRGLREGSDHQASN